MAELRGTKSRLLIAELRRLGGGPLTHEELYRRSPTIQKVFPNAIAVSRRLSDLYGTGSFLTRVSQKQEGGRKQYAYQYKEEETLGSARGSGIPDASGGPAEGSGPSSSIQRARAALGLAKTPHREPVSPSINPAPNPQEPSVQAPEVISATKAGPAVRPVSVKRKAAEPPLERPEEAKASPFEPAKTQNMVREDPLAHMLTGIFSDLLTQLIDDLAPSFRRALASAPQTEQVREALQRAIQPTGPEVAEEFEATGGKAETQKGPVLKVLVVGLLGQQADSLRQVVKDRAKLLFWNEDRVSEQLKQLIDNSQVVIGATKFISHAVDGVLSRADHYMRIHGGVSKIRLELEKLLQNPPEDLVSSG